MITAIGAAAVSVPAGAAFAATSSGSQYGPPPVTTPAAAGGFTSVITTETIGPGGGTIGPVAVAGGNVTVTVPPGAFAKPVEITVAAPDLATIPPQAGHAVTAGAGITVGLNGARFPGAYLKALTATFTSPHIMSTGDVMVWNGKSFVVDPTATSTAGVASVSFGSDPDFAIEVLTAKAHGHHRHHRHHRHRRHHRHHRPMPMPMEVPGATVPVTGVPVLGEGILAGGLILGGAGGIAASRRRRARVFSARD